MSSDILAADRFFQPESNKVYPLFVHQRIILQEIVKRQFLFIQIMRGGAKSSSVARGLLDYALMYPNTPIVIISASYRQAMLVFDEIYRLIEMNSNNPNSNFNIKNEVVGEIKRGTMEAIVRFRNGSTLKAVPFGDGSKIRGLRSGVIFIDEFYQTTEEAYESHIAPIAMVKQRGIESKIIVATTSWYQDCFAYKRLMQIASEVKAGNTAYGILDFNLEDIKSVTGSNFLSDAVLKDARRHGNPQTYAMTFYNIWPAIQGRWYEQKVIDDAISSKHGVKIQLKRAKENQHPHIVIIDLASSEKGDSTCMMAAEYVDGQLRYVYGKKAQGWGPHRRAWEAHQMIEKFDPVFVIYDSHGAIGTDFATAMARDTLAVEMEDDKTLIKKVTPVIHYNENNRRGRRVLIPVNPKDDAVVFALTDRRDGDVGGEDGMNNLLHTKMRDALWDGKVIGPGLDGIVPSENTGEIQYLGSEQEALDVVREAFLQLGKISLDKDLQGNQKQTKSGNLVFKKKSGTSVDDGAFCLVYGMIGLCRLNGSTNEQKRYNGRSQPMTMYPQVDKGSDYAPGGVQRLMFG